MSGQTRSRATRKRPRNGIPRRPTLRIAEGLRWSRVRTARARIAADYYERPEVKGVVVDALMVELRGR